MELEYWRLKQRLKWPKFPRSGGPKGGGGGRGRGRGEIKEFKRDYKTEMNKHYFLLETASTIGALRRTNFFPVLVKRLKVFFTPIFLCVLSLSVTIFLVAPPSQIYLFLSLCMTSAYIHMLIIFHLGGSWVFKKPPYLLRFHLIHLLWSECLYPHKIHILKY